MYNISIRRVAHRHQGDVQGRSPSDNINNTIILIIENYLMF